MPKSDDWTKRENCLLMDINTYEIKIYKRTRGKFRLYLGKITKSEFIATIETINNLSNRKEQAIRNKVREFIIKNFKKPKEEIDKYLENLDKFQKQYQLQNKLLKTF
ncbi:MAG: hypothetical protein WC123_05035 [Bacilli bacterium]